MGYIKRTPLTEFRAQNRGGVGSKGTETRDAAVSYTHLHYELLFIVDIRSYASERNE